MKAILKWFLVVPFYVAYKGNWNYISSIAALSVGFVAFSVVEAGIETLFWGAPFQHSLDWLFLAVFVLWLLAALWACYLASRRN